MKAASGRDVIFQKLGGHRWRVKCGRRVAYLQKNADGTAVAEIDEHAVQYPSWAEARSAVFAKM